MPTLLQFWIAWMEASAQVLSKALSYPNISQTPPHVLTVPNISPKITVITQYETADAA
jgi:hypothetical protein